MFIRIFLVLLMGTTPTFGCSLKSNFDSATRELTSNVLITCQHDLDQNLTGIRILKLMNEKQWEYVANISETGTIKTAFKDATVTGRLDNVAKSYIEIKFDVATKNTFGKFWCEVEETMNATQGANTFNVLRSKYIEINEQIVNNSQLLDMVLDSKKKLNEIRKNVLLYRWPAGEYTFLKPKTGCPGPEFESSSLRIATLYNPYKTNYKTTYSGLNLHGNVLEIINGISYVNMEMCSLKTQNAPEWPRGSYCMMLYNGETSCPKGFKSGSIRVGRLNDNKKDVFENLPNYDKWNTAWLTSVNYCCRDDGKPEIPMILPRRSPFILYRFGGQCQVIEGMNETNLNLYFAVAKGASSFFGSHPDASINSNDLTIETCHYRPSD